MKTVQTTKPAKAATKTATKPATKPTAKAEAKPAVVTLHVPANRPTAGAYLFAWTFAAMNAVKALPKAKQAKAAQTLHGARACAYHGADGTKAMIQNADGSVSYSSHFGIGEKAMDDKRRAIPASWADAFAAYIKSGKLPEKAPDGFAWKAAPEAAVILNVTL